MTKKTMETGKNVATNNYIVALWSSEHYKSGRDTKRDNVFIGQIRNVRTKEIKFFNNAAQFLTYMRAMYVADEKARRKK